MRTARLIGVDTLRTGRLLGREVLGSESFYRVVEARDRLVEVEVVDAPGLACGIRFRITRGAARAMRQLHDVPATDAAPHHVSRFGRPALG